MLFLARRQWEARAALEKVPLALELFIEGVLIFKDVLEELVENTAKGPHVGCLIILLFDQAHFGGPVPS